MAEFPGATPAVPEPSPSQWMDDPGFELDLVIARAARNINAIAAKLGFSSAVAVDTPPGSLKVLLSDAANKSKWDNVSQRLETIASSNVDISSTSYTDIATRTITTTGGDLLVWSAHTYFTTAGSPANWLASLRVDSGSDTEIVYAVPTAVGAVMATPKLFTGVSAGAHTVALRGRYTGTGTVRIQDRVLIVLELKA